MTAQITRIRTIQPRANAAWTLAKVETSEPGLHGIGSASGLFRPGTVPPAVEVLAQGLVGRDPDEVEDIRVQLGGYAGGGFIEAGRGERARGGPKSRHSRRFNWLSCSKRRGTG